MKKIIKAFEIIKKDYKTLIDNDFVYNITFNKYTTAFNLGYF